MKIALQRGQFLRVVDGAGSTVTNFFKGTAS
jgi:uncharacterized protein YcgI (DUF1989 family)